MVERTDAGQVGTLRVIALCLHFLLGALIILLGQHRDRHSLGEDDRLCKGKNVLIDPVQTDCKREREAEEREQRHGPVHHLRAASVCALLFLHRLRLIGELAGQLHREHLREEADERDERIENDVDDRRHSVAEDRHASLADEVVPDEHRGHRQIKPEEIEVRQVGECGQ